LGSAIKARIQLELDLEQLKLLEQKLMPYSPERSNSKNKFAQRSMTERARLRMRNSQVAVSRRPHSATATAVFI